MPHRAQLHSRHSPVRDRAPGLALEPGLQGPSPLEVGAMEQFWRVLALKADAQRSYRRSADETRAGVHRSRWTIPTTAC